jgi:DNA-binding transcriptional MerR regulator
MLQDMRDALLGTSPVTVPEAGLAIGEAAAACGLSIDTLRYYEREGLTLHPAPRSGSGQRRYGEGDLAWLSGLVMLRGTGMSIAEIRDFADLSRMPGTEAERLVLLERHRERVLEQLARTQQHLSLIDAKITGYRRVVDERAGKETP